jgi:hypothetical protein
MIGAVKTPLPAGRVGPVERLRQVSIHACPEAALASRGSCPELPGIHARCGCTALHLGNSCGEGGIRTLRGARSSTQGSDTGSLTTRGVACLNVRYS